MGEYCAFGVCTIFHLHLESNIPILFGAITRDPMS